MMKALIHRLLYRILPFEAYLRVVSRMFFLWQRLGIGRFDPATEYVYHLPQLVHPGDVCIDIGANLGYYARTLARLVGNDGRVWAVEPVAPIRKVLSRNLRRCPNTEIIPFALGAEERNVAMGNDSARETGYFGTGQNFVNDSGADVDVAFRAEMRRGSRLFAHLRRLDFIKCDIEGYETVVMEEMRPLIERFHPIVLIESGGENRRQIIRLFAGLGYDAFVLDHGREVPLTPEATKDIIFRYAH